MKVEREVDGCIVGLGATRAVARRLAAAGLNIVALEAGPPRTGHQHLMDELIRTY